jgi:magnesium transporter
VTPATHRQLVDGSGTLDSDVSSSAVCTRLAERSFFWLDIEGPGEPDFDLLRNVLHIHPLAIEDAQNFNQRPKIDDYDDFTALVVYGAATGIDGEEPQSLRAVEVHCFYSERFLVTVHQEQIEVFDELRAQYRRRTTKTEEGLWFLYLAVDALVDTFFPRLAELDQRIDALEDAIFGNPEDDHLMAVRSMRRQLVSLRAIVVPQRDMFAALVGGRHSVPGMTTDTAHHFRDVYDHLARVADDVDTHRDLLTGTLDIYLSTVSTNLNVIMKQLGIVSAIILPLALLTSFYGQNFPWLVSHIGGAFAFFVLGLGLEAAAVLAALAVFRRRGWF